MKPSLPILFVFALLSGCGQTSPPTLVDYEVINREESGAAKVSFDVRINLVDGRLPTTSELAAISRHLHDQEKRHDRTFVVFYLPGMQVDAGGFATAHHNPNLEVKIMSFNVPDQYSHLLPQEKTTVANQTPKKEPAPLQPLEELEVEITIETRRDSAGKLQIFGATNLPNGTKLSLSLSNAAVNFMAQDETQVTNSAYESAWFSKKGQPLPPGQYEASVTVPIGNTQPEDVKRILGPKLEKMTGELVSPMKIEALGNTASTKKLISVPQ